MRIEIYFFSGTGNSLQIAKDIANRIDASLVPIASLIDQESIQTDATAIGIVFPVYYGDLPNIINKEILKENSRMSNRNTYLPSVPMEEEEAFLLKAYAVLSIRVEEGLLPAMGFICRKTHFTNPGKIAPGYMRNLRRRLNV
jgi:menaquinone-dependent protoporphyrinogen IX oxidase